LSPGPHAVAVVPLDVPELVVEVIQDARKAIDPLLYQF